jgi:cupin 2 domain-containing protein
MANIFDDATPPSVGERFEPLLERRDLRIERIVSSAQPDTRVYDQAQDEWVVLLRGEAELEVEGVKRQLREGDHLFLAAHTVHRVLRCSEGAVWLALHMAR